MINNYQLLEANDPQRLDTLVRDALKVGWKLYGNPVVAATPDTDQYDREWSYCQAMVRESA